MENPNFRSDYGHRLFFRLFSAIFVIFIIFNSTRVNYVLEAKFFRQFEFWSNLVIRRIIGDFRVSDEKFFSNEHGNFMILTAFVKILR
jgi:hypothetical protein